jgi:hypothetical protein
VITTARREQEFSLGRALGEPPAPADMAKSASTVLFQEQNRSTRGLVSETRHLGPDTIRYLHAIIFQGVAQCLI